MNDGTQTVLSVVLDELHDKRQRLERELQESKGRADRAKKAWLEELRYRDEVAAALRAMTPRKPRKRDGIA